MGIHSDALALAAKSGQPIQECKRAIKGAQADIADALRKSPGMDRIDVLAGVLYGVNPPTPVVEKAIEIPIEPQVQEPVVEKQVIETHDSEDMGVVLKDEEKKSSKKKKKSKRNPKQG